MCEYTLRIAATFFRDLLIRHWRMGSMTSPHTRASSREQQIERTSDGAFGRILHGNDRVADRSGFHSAEDFVYGGARRERHVAVPKCLSAASWLYVPSGPRNATRHLVFERAARRHDLGVNALERAGSATGPAFRSAMRRSTCASRSGPVDRGTLFDCADLLRRASRATKAASRGAHV